MVKVDKQNSGWMIALSWLSALEETARDFHGTRPKVFCERAYDHSVQYYLRILGDEYGLQIENSESIRDAVEQYIQIGVRSGLFHNESEFELENPNPHRLDVTVHNCEYQQNCQALIDDGFSIRDLTCARIGCFRAAVKILANVDSNYEVRSYNINGDCQGTIERV